MIKYCILQDQGKKIDIKAECKKVNCFQPWAMTQRACSALY